MESEASREQRKLTNSMLPFLTLPLEVNIAILSRLEVNIEILLRLPVNSVLKMRSVSKSCLAFTSTPEFIKAHLNLSAEQKLLLRFNQLNYNLKKCSVTSLLYSSVLEAFDLDYPVNTSFWAFVDSVNGLICLSNNREKHLCLWNPSIRKHKKLPNCTTNLRDAARFSYGFGYDEFHEDYNVVASVHHHRSLSSVEVEVKIDSLKDYSWRSIHFPWDWVQSFNYGKFVNEKLHWANICQKGWNIIFLDLAYEKWEKVEQPCIGEEDGVLVLGVLGNNLSVICNGNCQGTNLDVWIMEYGIKESWTKMFTFKYSHPPMMFVFDPPLLIADKDKILLMYGKTFLLYNLKDESITYTELTTFGSDLVSLESIYLESLVSLVLQNDHGHNKNEGCRSSDGLNCEVKADVRNN